MLCRDVAAEQSRDANHPLAPDHAHFTRRPVGHDHDDAGQPLFDEIDLLNRLAGLVDRLLDRPTDGVQIRPKAVELVVRQRRQEVISDDRAARCRHRAFRGANASVTRARLGQLKNRSDSYSSACIPLVR
jgi:hypothetical protein